MFCQWWSSAWLSLPEWGRKRDENEDKETPNIEDKWLEANKLSAIYNREKKMSLKLKKNALALQADRADFTWCKMLVPKNIKAYCSGF